MSAFPRIARHEIGDQRRDLGTRILLDGMPPLDEMRSLGMRQELLETAGKGRMVKDVVLAPPNDQRGQPAPGELLFDPIEPLQRTRRRVERDPARPCPGEETGRRVRQYPIVRLLRALAKPVP